MRISQKLEILHLKPRRMSWVKEAIFIELTAMTKKREDAISSWIVFSPRFHRAEGLHYPPGLIALFWAPRWQMNGLIARLHRPCPRIFFRPFRGRLCWPWPCVVFFGFETMTILPAIVGDFAISSMRPPQGTQLVQAN